MCSIEDDSASGDSDEESADADSQPRPELPEEMAAELQAAAEADRDLAQAEGQEKETEELQVAEAEEQEEEAEELAAEAEKQEAETEKLQVAPVEPELLADQHSESLSEGSLGEEPGLQQSVEALEELQAVRFEEESDSAADSAAVGGGVVATAEAEAPSADQGLEGLKAEGEEQTGLENGSDVGSADAAGDEVDADAAEEEEVHADAAEEDKVHAPTELELQNGMKAPQLQPDAGKDEAVSEPVSLDPKPLQVT